MKKYFQTSVVFAAPEGEVDSEIGIIRGITVARIGTAKGHEGEIDFKFLEQVVEKAAKRPQGVKARFGHPNMCSTALGTYLGRFHNYVLTGNSVKADLHLDETSKNTPNGNLYDYVLKLSGTSPDMFGASLVFETDEFEIKEVDKAGKKEKLRYFRLKELRATDIVDEPAATEGLFSEETLPGQVTTFLDENPELTEFIFSKPDVVAEFLNNYLNSNTMKFTDEVKAKFKKYFTATETKAIENLQEPETSITKEAPAEETEQVETEQTVETETTKDEDVKKETPAECFETEVKVEKPRDPSALIIEGFYDNLFENGLTGETPATSLETKLEEIVKTFQNLVLMLDENKKEIDQLNAKLSAKPSIPKNVTDPQLSVNVDNTGKDETGKQLLKNIPADLKRKLRSK